MFLKKVYRYSKWMFGGMLFFMLVQLLFFWKGLVLFSPWYNFGMYSEVISPQKEYQVYNISSNWPANVQLLSPQRDDKVFVTLDQYHNLPQNGFMYKTQIRKKFAMLHLPMPDSSLFTTQITRSNFQEWFVLYNGFWVGQAINIDKKTAIWDGKILRISPSYFTNTHANIQPR